MSFFRNTQVGLVCLGSTLALGACTSVVFESDVGGSVTSSGAGGVGGGGISATAVGSGGQGGASSSSGTGGSIATCTQASDCQSGQECSDGVCVIVPLAIDAGTDRTCALLADATVRCWGITPGGDDSWPVPTLLSLASASGAARAIAVNGRNVCVKSKTAPESRIYCLGDKDVAWLDAAINADPTQPVFVNDDAACWYEDTVLTCASASTAVQVTKQAPVGVGGNRVCTSTGTSVDCAGTFDSDPIFSHIIPGVTDIWVAPDHVCFANATSFVCRGKNDQRQLGDVQTTPAGGAEDEIATYLRDLLQIRLVDVGQARTCFVVEGEPSIVQCWGPNLWGGQGNVSTVSLPVTAIRQLAVGDRHVCALAGDGAATKVYCWGNNERGQLGNGTMGPTADPVLVTFSP